MKTNKILLLFIFFLLGFIIFYEAEVPIQKARINSDNEGTSGAYQALSFWTHSRAYPEKDIPAKKYFAEYERQKNQLSKTSSILEMDNWETRGPHNVPGRMISLALNPLNPKTLYTGSASGGLWRTYNALQSGGWHRIRTGFPVLGVMGIAIDPVDTNTIYIGTGEVYGYKKSIGGTVVRTTRGSYGVGILKTTDGGETWGKSLDWTFNQERGVQAIRINPLNSNILFAATTEGIYKTTNAGENWNLILPVLMGEDIIIHPTDTNKIIVSCGNLGSEGSGIYYSLDGGTSWNGSNGISPFTGKTLMDYYASNPDVVFASVADSLNGKGLYKSLDFGMNWNRLHTTDVPQYQGFFAHWVAVHPTDPNQLVHAGVQIYKSNDGGQTVSLKGGPHVDHHNYTHHPSNPDILYIACAGKYDILIGWRDCQG